MFIAKKHIARRTFLRGAGVTLALPTPFVVAATMNPIEYEGTYTLPEAQLDLFLLKLVLDVP